MRVPDPERRGIELVEEADRSVVMMWGEIDAALRLEASAALANALLRRLPVVIDANQVTFIDSTGVSFLVQFHTIGRREGLAVRLLEPPEEVGDVLQLLGVANVLVPDDAWPQGAQ